MIVVKINKEDGLKVNNHFLEVEFSLKKGKLLRVEGENGIGKSSLLQYLKRKQDLFFQEESCQFLDQSRLSPLNQVCFDDLMHFLQTYRREDSTFFLNFLKVIEAYRSLPINQLSGGQNQMVKLALSLYIGGSVFLLDEPFQFLDKENQLCVFEMIEWLKSEGKKILIIEHQVDISKVVDETSSIQVVN